jgi:hypothetical protein
MAKQFQWKVEIIRAKLERLATVTAPDEAAARRAAIKEFQIEPARQNRIAVTKIGEAD